MGDLERAFALICLNGDLNERSHGQLGSELSETAREREIERYRKDPRVQDMLEGCRRLGIRTNSELLEWLKRERRIEDR